MQDGIIKGTGNSRYLKSIADFLTQYPTYNDFAAALAAGTLPIDLNGINETGWDQLGTALNKANLLSDETAQIISFPSSIPEHMPAISDIPNPSWTCCAYGAGKFVAFVSALSVYPILCRSAYSENGKDWIVQNNLSNEFIALDVCFEGGKFVAVGYDRSTFSKIMYSTDGISWTAANVPQLQNLRLSYVAFGNGKFVAIAGYKRAVNAYVTSNLCLYSEDGISWSQTTLPQNVVWGGLAYGNGKFVAVSLSSTSSPSARSSIAAYSSDGVSWTQATLPELAGWSGICYGESKFIAISSVPPAPDSGDSSLFAYSSDGINWEAGYFPASAVWDNIFFADGKFIVTAQEQIYLYSLDDGDTWFAGVPYEAYTVDFAYGNSLYMILASGGALTVLEFPAPPTTPNEAIYALAKSLADVSAAILALTV